MIKKGIFLGDTYKVAYQKKIDVSRKQFILIGIDAIPHASHLAISLTKNKALVTY